MFNKKQVDIIRDPWQVTQKKCGGWLPRYVSKGNNWSLCPDAN